MRHFAISDIHGCAQTFQRLIEDVLKLMPGDRFFLLGDYFSRGPDAKGVLDYVQHLQSRGHIGACLMGNHEHRMLLRHRAGLVDIDRPFLDFIDSLQFFYEWDAYLFIHAGLDCSLPDPKVGLFDILYARSWEHQLDERWLGARTIVHGHERHSRKEITDRVEKRRNVLSIDNGCSTPDASGQGALCALHLEKWDLYFQPNIDGKKASRKQYFQFGATVP